MSLFGGTSTPFTSQPPNLFGGTNTNTGTSLFGTNGQPNNASPGLFGSNSTSSAATPSASKPAFSFGTPSVTTPSNNSIGGGLFGQQQQQQQQPQQNINNNQPSLFGGFGGGSNFNNDKTQGNQTSASPGLFSSSIGSSNLAGPSASTNTNAAVPPLTKTTKFNDLPDGARSIIEEIDNYIRSQTQLSENLKSQPLGEQIINASESYEQCAGEATSVSNLLDQDSRQLSELRAKLESDMLDLAKVTAIIEGFKNPQTKGAAAKNVANFPFEYFSRRAETFQYKIGRFNSIMDQIQQQVDVPDTLNPSAIAPALRAQHTSFMALAAQVADLNSELKLLKDDYRSIWREKTGSVQDPFFQAAKARGRGMPLDKAMEGIELR